MGKRCCIDGCKKKKGEEISVYRFPSKDDQPEERDRWINSVPKVLLKREIGDETVLCRRHWPEETEMIKCFGKNRPVCPPSLFNGVAKSQLPTALPPLRTTSRCLAEERRGPVKTAAQLMAAFKIEDMFTFESLKTALLIDQKQLSLPTTIFIAAGVLLIQSLDFIHGVPKFLIKIFSNLRFESYHVGVKCYISTLTANRISILNSWSRLEEALRYLKLLDISRHKEVLCQQIEIMQPRVIGKPVYSNEVMVRAFEYFCTSRSIYNRLREGN